MKPEPLKDKQYNITKTEYRSENDEESWKVCDSKDIRSAVEWLKEQIRTPYNKVDCTEKDLFAVIDEAFKDVIKE